MTSTAPVVSDSSEGGRPPSGDSKQDDRSRTASSKTFRLQGISSEYREEDVKQLIQATLLRDDGECSFTVRSLARDPYRRNLKMATLDVPKPPKLSGGNSNTEWQYQNEDGVSVVLDSHFTGFTALHTPSDSDWTME